LAYAQAKPLDREAIPVIDISALRDNSDPVGVAQKLHAASQNLGFIYISGHGIPDAVVQDARNTAYDFFRSPESQKSAVSVSPEHRGWIGHGGAKMQDDAKADLKESFIWGLEDNDGITPQDHPLRGANKWPGFLPQLQACSMDYFQHAHAVAHHLMRGFALGLMLDENFFLQTASRPLSRASYVYYPAQAASAGKDQFGVGPHTDFGVLTVLCQDSVGGLQVQDINGDWIEAPPIDGTLVVNVADLLSRWTGGAYKSTPHRVVNSSGRERLSLVLAFDPDPETLIDARAIFDTAEVEAEEPITCGDYLVWRFNKAFAYRKS
jgi:isopenicillin N synthase-like dioxygenase